MKGFKQCFLFTTLTAWTIASGVAVASEATIERKVTVDDRYGGQHQLTQKVYDQGEDFYTFVRDGRLKNWSIFTKIFASRWVVKMFSRRQPLWPPMLFKT